MARSECIVELAVVQAAVRAAAAVVAGAMTLWGCGCDAVLW